MTYANRLFALHKNLHTVINGETSRADKLSKTSFLLLYYYEKNLHDTLQSTTKGHLSRQLLIKLTAAVIALLTSLTSFVAGKQSEAFCHDFMFGSWCPPSWLTGLTATAMSFSQTFVVGSAALKFLDPQHRKSLPKVHKAAMFAFVPFALGYLAISTGQAIAFSP